MHAPLECSQPPIITLLDRGLTGVALELRLGPFSQSKAFVDNLAQNLEVGNNGRDIPKVPTVTIIYNATVPRVRRKTPHRGDINSRFIVRIAYNHMRPMYWCSSAVQSRSTCI